MDMSFYGPSLLQKIIRYVLLALVAYLVPASFLWYRLIIINAESRARIEENHLQTQHNLLLLQEAGHEIEKIVRLLKERVQSPVHKYPFEKGRQTDGSLKR